MYFFQTVVEADVFVVTFSTARLRGGTSYQVKRRHYGPKPFVLKCCLEIEQSNVYAAYTDFTHKNEIERA